MEESTRCIAKERRKSIEEIDGGKVVRRDEFMELRQEVEKMRGQFMTVASVDKRIGENL